MTNRSKVGMIVASLLFVGSSATAVEFDPDGVCDGFEPVGVECQVIVGAGLSHKSLLGVGLGICTDTGLPLACDATPGSVAGAGAASFDASGWAAGNHLVSVWVEHLPGAVPCLPATEVCGFEISLCNDRDINDVCTRTAGTWDQIFSSQSNEAALAPDCADADKDVKDCGDDLDAGLVGLCLETSMTAAGGPDWYTDQIKVFVGNWVDSNPSEPNVGAGISAGSYEVWITFAAAPLCVPSPTATAPRDLRAAAPAFPTGVMSCDAYNDPAVNVPAPYPGQDLGFVVMFDPVDQPGDVAACAGIVMGPPCAPGMPGLLLNNVPQGCAPTLCSLTGAGPGVGWTVGVGANCIGLPWVVPGAAAPCPATAAVNARVFWGTTPGFAPGSMFDVCVGAL